MPPTVEQVRPGSYRGCGAWLLESGDLQCAIVPALGGKIASLRSRRTGREFLVQPGRLFVTPPRPGQAFVDSDPFGFDDMFPTVLAGSPPGPRLRWDDHGEVWSRAWQSTVEGESVMLTVDCQSVPFRVTRRCAFVAPRVLALDYVVTNLSNAGHDALWAAHPLFACSDAVELDLPPGDVISTLASTRYGPAGTRSRWQPLRLPPAQPGQPAVAHKFYAAAPDQVREVSLHFPNDGERLTLRFRSDEPAYFGLWQEERTDGTRILAPESCTGGFDRPDLARQRGQPSHFAPWQEKRWRLELELGAFPAT